VKERTINHNIVIPANDQAAIIAQPGERPLNLPSPPIPSQLATVMITPTFIVTAVRANQFDAATRQSLSIRIAVIRLVGDDASGLFSRSASAIPRHGDLIYRFFEQRDFRRGCRVQVVSQRNTLAVDHHHPLRSLAAFGRSDASAPFFAGAKLPSAKASDQSSWPRPSSSERNARHASNQTSCSSHCLSRRQQVEGLGYRLGKSAHGAPVRRIQRMPSNTRRLSAHGRPPFRDFLGFGSKTSSFFHCSSVNFCRSLAIEKLLSMAVYHKSLHGASLNSA
jgi:hypothetical protein